VRSEHSGPNFDQAQFSAKLKRAMKFLYKSVKSEIDDCANSSDFDNLLAKNIRLLMSDSVVESLMSSPSHGTNHDHKLRKTESEVSTSSPDNSKQYLFFDPSEKLWKPQPPEPPSIEDDDNEDADL